MATNVWTPYTADPHEAVAVIFPNHSMQLLDSLVHYFGITILTYCFAVRSCNEDLSSIKGWLNLTWPRLVILLTFLFSWIFVLTTGILVNGIGMSYTAGACRMGIYACIIFYALTKVLIYSFLTEKVLIVWAVANGTQSRMRSNVYRICCFIMTGYIGIFITMVIGQISEFRHDGVCIIGLKPFSSVTLLSYDLFINVFLTSMFVYPLIRHGFMNPRIRKVATRTLVAALAALTTSSVNIAILTVMHGRQLGWVCLASCGTDVTLNAVVLFWVTSHNSFTKDLPSNGVVASPNPQSIFPSPQSQSDDDKRRRETQMFNSQQLHTQSSEGLHRSETKRNMGVSGWLDRLRATTEEDAHRMEVQVTVMTEMEMEDLPEHKSNGSSQLVDDIDPAGFHKV